MQYIDFARTDTAAAVEAEIRRLVEGAYLTPQQGQAVRPEKITAFFASPLGRAVRGSAALHREFKFSLLADAGDYYPDAGAGSGCFSRAWWTVILKRSRALRSWISRRTA